MLRRPLVPEARSDPMAGICEPLSVMYGLVTEDDHPQEPPQLRIMCRSRPSGWLGLVAFDDRTVTPFPGGGREVGASGKRFGSRPRDVVLDLLGPHGRAMDTERHRWQGEPVKRMQE